MRVTLLVGLAVLVMGMPANARLLHGSVPTFEGANWREVLEKVDCGYVTKDGRDLKIAAKLAVDGKTFQNPTITEEDRIKELEKRCFPKH
jgi:hypothetical protein